MSRVAIIPARGDSRRIPGKNIKPFHGKPIIAFSIEMAISTRLFSAVIVTTNDKRIADIASAHGSIVYMRNPALAEDAVGTQEVMADVLKYHPEANTACCIYATAPLMIKSDLIKGLGMLASRVEPYVYPTNAAGVDAGQWYWGRVDAFVAEVPLAGNSQHLIIPDARHCDINTPEDWLRAEQLYTDLMVGM